MNKKAASTGLEGLDKILCGLEEGDNIVYQVDSIEDYLPFIRPYYEYAQKNGLKPVYFRFARHTPLVAEDSGVEIHQLHPEDGFDGFIKEFHEIIDRYGSKGYYIFDCLSELVVDWYSDRMLGNFFMLVCPYILRAKAIAYFAMLRNRHSFHATTPIMDTLQVFLDVYRFREKLYVHPIQATGRYSPTMNMMHVRQGDDFIPVIDSVTITQVLADIPWSRLDSASYRLGFWSSTFAKAEELEADFERGEDVAHQVDEMFARLLRMEISHNERVLNLAQQYFNLADLLNIRKRMIGTGLIGGKSVGMLLARAILGKMDKKLLETLEPHDSFFIGSDVFYTFLVQNGIWWMREQQKKAPGFLEGAEETRNRILKGKFPEYIVKQFVDLLDYFGQSPIIVRSSSLLEDSFGNAFAGKYESIFCANQGPRPQRLDEFISALRRVYASTLSDDALTYRLQRGLDQQDEQMAILVQRVSGSYRGPYFFPDLAGVGVSYNTFVWEPHLDPKAGMLRLVFGLGTRAVNRVDDDYPQTIALDQPLLRPYADREDVSRFSQHNLDLLDTSQNCLRTVRVNDLLNDKLNVQLDLIASPDPHAERKMKELGMKGPRPWLVTFKKLLSDTNFTAIMRNMLKTLENHYQYPVDIEFTVNFTDDDSFKINLVQCRPLQTKGSKANVRIPENIGGDKVLFASRGYTMGGSIAQPIKRIIYVDPQAYVEIPNSQKYSIARLIGKLNRQITNREITPTLLFGPGRWGTTTPSLGVPVIFSEINKITALVEIAYEGGNLMPELSFGTHFFQDLVESDIFYVALFTQKEAVVFNLARLMKMPNLLTRFLPVEQQFADVVKVYEIESDRLQIMCDIVSQEVICFFTC